MPFAGDLGFIRAERGRPILLAVLDAFWRDENSVKPDEELCKALEPALASLAPHSMIIGITSPCRKAGLLYKKYKQHFEGWRRARHPAPTRTLNPTVAQEIVDRAVA